MKIRTRLQLGVAAMTVVVVTATVIIALTFRQIREADMEHEWAHSVVKGMFELNILTHDYVMHAGGRAQVQWLTKHASLTEL